MEVEMIKGTIKISKNGGGTIKPYESKKEINVPKEFEYGDLIPLSGNNKFECEFELNEDNKVERLIIEGKEISKSEKVIQQKEDRANRNLEAEKLEKERLEKERKNQKMARSQSSNDKVHDSFKISETRLPSDVRGISVLQNADADIDNFNLKFHKAARFIEDAQGKVDKDKFYFYKNDHNPKRNTGHSFHIKAKFDTEFIDYIIQTQKNSIDKEKRKELEFELDWRLAIGLGVDNVYETGISLHHIYGIPYIPSSGIKGIVRSWYILDKHEMKEQSEANALKDEVFCKIFGSDDKGFEGKATQGKIIFLDAFPTSEPKVEADIMNPHYPDYYGDSDNKKDIAPTDFQNPRPINFLTVKDCSFQFILGIRDLEDKGLLETASEWLKEALTQKGIGAKTAVGYGYMSEQ